MGVQQRAVPDHWLEEAEEKASTVEGMGDVGGCAVVGREDGKGAGGMGASSTEGEDVVGGGRGRGKGGE